MRREISAHPGADLAVPGVNPYAARLLSSHPGVNPYGARLLSAHPGFSGR
jgi:hypothetical protein